MKTSVVLAEWHTAVREGVKSLLETANGYIVVGQTGDGVEAIRLVTELQPDLLITGLALPRLGGIEITRQTRRLSPHTRVVILSPDNREEVILKSLRAGAKGFILKHDSLDQIVRALDQVMSGHWFLSPSILGLAVNVLLEKRLQRTRSVYDTLTTREREVFQLTAQGLSSLQIAEKLFISKRTVDVHRTNLLRKLGLKTGGNQLRAYAIQKGIVTDQDE